MGLRNKAVEVQNLQDDDVDSVNGVSIDDVLKVMRENKIIKIVNTRTEGLYRLVFSLDVSKSVYQRKISD